MSFDYLSYWEIEQEEQENERQQDFIKSQKDFKQVLEQIKQDITETDTEQESFNKRFLPFRVLDIKQIERKKKPKKEQKKSFIELLTQTINKQ